MKSTNTLSTEDGPAETLRSGVWFGAFFDEHGRTVRRTKYTHPYNYDGFVQERCGKNSEANGTVYTDRLLQWDYELTRKLLKKHFKDTGIDVGGDYWGARPAKTIEGFLRERLEQPELRVILVMEYCNQATGYPVWRIDYHVPPSPNTEAEPCGGRAQPVGTPANEDGQ